MSKSSTTLSTFRDLPSDELKAKIESISPLRTSAAIFCGA